jgi:GTPase
MKRHVTFRQHIGTIQKYLECLRGGYKNTIMYFEFIQGTYFLLENYRFIFREGNTRRSGNVMKIIE